MFIGGERMFRGFIAIKIPFNDQMEAFWNAIKRSGARIKLVEPYNTHITLKFLGNTAESLIPNIEEIIRNAVEGLKPFEIELKGCGAFPTSTRPRVVWIGVKEGADTLKKIAESIDCEVSKLGFEKEKRPFVAHLTVGRVKGSQGALPRVLAEWANKDFGRVLVDKIFLMKSILKPEGPEYHEVVTVSIGEE